ncbi:MAG: YigZ family protein [Candidatus Eremiobacterota bacterium]
MIEKFNTINKDFGPFEFKEKGSKFISYLFPVSTEEEADKILNRLKKEFYDATHICYSYRIGRGIEEYVRINDAGEPSGTAGRPIYQEIIRRDLFNVLLAVIRYFGGIKLGKGGLQRAYSGASRNVIDISDIVIYEIRKKVTLSIPFNLIGEIINMAGRSGIKILSQEYTQEGVSMLLSVPAGKLEAFQARLTEKTAGKIHLVNSE